MLNNVQLQLSTYVYPGAQEVVRQHNVTIKLPKDLLTKIFENVDSYKSLRAIQLVCKKWRAIVIDPKTYARIESAGVLHNSLEQVNS